MAQKPSIPKGTRDFLPAEVVKRTYIFNTIRKSFEIYGFAPIETPSFENIETLMGKYGDEGDNLMFKILKRGEKFEAENKSLIKWARDSDHEFVITDFNKLSNTFADSALRYDLTVPFARFVVQHQNDLSFPFKRYQIQPVWRADRPQKGRYREFFQCDADVVGSDSLLYEVDFVLLFDEVLTNLNLPDFTIQINNRKILSGIAEVSGESDKLIQITVAIDKLDKIGKDGVVKELLEKGVSEAALEKINPLFDITGDTKSRLSQMKSYLASSEIGLEGVSEMEFVLDQVEELGLKRAKVEFDVTLARGLNYYTGAIFEVKANGVNMGSICGGGRYDDLTGIFGMKNMSGVGISFGADRIYDVLTELELFPEAVDNTLDLLFINFGEMEEKHCLKLVQKMRAAGVSSELYPSFAKMKKQMNYANDRKVKNVALMGENEIEKGILRIKNMESGEQTELSFDQAVAQLKA